MVRRNEMEPEWFWQLLLLLVWPTKSKRDSFTKPNGEGSVMVWMCFIVKKMNTTDKKKFLSRTFLTYQSHLRAINWYSNRIICLVIKPGWQWICFPRETSMYLTLLIKIQLKKFGNYCTERFKTMVFSILWRVIWKILFRRLVTKWRKKKDVKCRIEFSNW